MSTITSHVLDTSLGRPAANLRVRLELLDPIGEGQLLAARVTDADGRVRDLTPDAQAPGLYRLVFETGRYFSDTGRVTFYPRVEIVFRIDAPDQHYHVPLLLSPFGYSTYRGS
jgi:5-hydroxyisourate hydrolase